MSLDSKMEKRWMREIQFLYLKSFRHRPLPPVLLMRDQLEGSQGSGPPPSKYEEPYHTVTSDDLNPLKWIVEMNRGSPQHATCRRIIEQICAYQTLRQHRLNRFKRGKLNDPINLFFEELKAFLVQLTNMQSPLEIFTALEERLTYLRALQTQASLGHHAFPVLLKQITTQLGKLLPESRVAFFSNLLQRRLQELTVTSRALLRHLVYFIFYVLRDSPSTPQCLPRNLDGLRRPEQDLNLKRAMASTSGRCLEIVLLSKGFLELFPTGLRGVVRAAGKFMERNRRKEKGKAEKIRHRSPDFEQNPFLDASGKPILPNVFFSKQNEQGKYGSKANSPMRLLSPSALGNWGPGSGFPRPARGGIVCILRDQPQAPRLFLLLHALAPVLAHATFLCEEAAKLAPTSHLLQYKNANIQLRNVLALHETCRMGLKIYILELQKVVVEELLKLQEKQLEQAVEAANKNASSHKSSFRKESPGTTNVHATASLTNWRCNIRAAQFVNHALEQDVRDCEAASEALLSYLMTNEQSEVTERKASLPVLKWVAKLQQFMSEVQSLLPEDVHPVLEPTYLQMKSDISPLTSESSLEASSVSTKAGLLAKAGGAPSVEAQVFASNVSGSIVESSRNVHGTAVCSRSEGPVSRRELTLEERARFPSLLVDSLGHSDPERLARAQAALYAVQGQEALEAGDPSLATRLFTLAIELDPLNPEYPVRIAETHKWQKVHMPTLELPNTRICDGDIPAIVQEIEGKSLVKINLGNNSITGHGCQSLCLALAGSASTLKVLELPKNSLGNVGAQAVAKLLSDGRCCLVELDLQDNNIQAEGAEALAAALDSSLQSLRKLLLSHNPIGETGALALTKAVDSLDISEKERMPLRELSLERTNLGDQSGLALLRLVQEIPNLREVILSKKPKDMSLAIRDKLTRALRAKRPDEAETLGPIEILASESSSNVGGRRASTEMRRAEQEKQLRAVQAAYLSCLDSAPPPYLISIDAAAEYLSNAMRFGPYANSDHKHTDTIIQITHSTQAGESSRRGRKGRKEHVVLQTVATKVLYNNSAERWAAASDMVPMEWLCAENARNPNAGETRATSQVSHTDSGSKGSLELPVSGQMRSRIQDLVWSVVVFAQQEKKDLHRPLEEINKGGASNKATGTHGERSEDDTASFGLVGLLSPFQLFCREFCDFLAHTLCALPCSITTLHLLSQREEYVARLASDPAIASSARLQSSRKHEQQSTHGCTAASSGGWKPLLTMLRAAMAREQQYMAWVLRAAPVQGQLQQLERDSRAAGQQLLLLLFFLLRLSNKDLRPVLSQGLSVLMSAALPQAVWAQLCESVASSISAESFLSSSPHLSSPVSSNSPGLPLHSSSDSSSASPGIRLGDHTPSTPSSQNVTSIPPPIISRANNPKTIAMGTGGLDTGSTMSNLTTLSLKLLEDTSVALHSISGRCLWTLLTHPVLRPLLDPPSFQDDVPPPPCIMSEVSKRLEVDEHPQRGSETNPFLAPNGTLRLPTIVTGRPGLDPARCLQEAGEEQAGIPSFFLGQRRVLLLWTELHALCLEIGRIHSLYVLASSMSAEELVTSAGQGLEKVLHTAATARAAVAEALKHLMAEVKATADRIAQPGDSPGSSPSRHRASKHKGQLMAARAAWLPQLSCVRLLEPRLRQLLAACTSSSQSLRNSLREASQAFMKLKAHQISAAAHHDNLSASETVRELCQGADLAKDTLYLLLSQSHLLPAQKKGETIQGDTRNQSIDIDGENKKKYHIKEGRTALDRLSIQELRDAFGPLLEKDVYMAKQYLEQGERHLKEGQTDRAIRSLVLAIQRDPFLPKAAIYLAEAAKQRAERVEVRRNKLNLTDSQVGEVVQEIWDHDIKVVHLAFNCIGPAGAQELSRGLQSCATLQQLVLFKNRIGDQGMASLARVVRSSRSLQYLDVNENGVGSEGALVLAEALEENASLTRLDLGFNPLGDAGVTALADALRENPQSAVVDLRLSSTSMGDIGGLALIRMLAFCPSVCKVSIDNNAALSPELNAILAAKLQRRTRALHSLSKSQRTQLDRRIKESAGQQPAAFAVSFLRLLDLPCTPDQSNQLESTVDSTEKHKQVHMNSEGDEDESKEECSEGDSVDAWESDGEQVQEDLERKEKQSGATILEHSRCELEDLALQKYVHRRCFPTIAQLLVRRLDRDDGAIYAIYLDCRRLLGLCLGLIHFWPKSETKETFDDEKTTEDEVVDWLEVMEAVTNSLARRVWENVKDCVVLGSDEPVILRRTVSVIETEDSVPDLALDNKQGQSSFEDSLALRAALVRSACAGKPVLRVLDKLTMVRVASGVPSLQPVLRSRAGRTQRSVQSLREQAMEVVEEGIADTFRERITERITQREQQEKARHREQVEQQPEVKGATVSTSTLSLSLERARLHVDDENLDRQIEAQLIPLSEEAKLHQKESREHKEGAKELEIEAAFRKQEDWVKDFLFELTTLAKEMVKIRDEVVPCLPEHWQAWPVFWRGYHTHLLSALHNFYSSSAKRKARDHLHVTRWLQWYEQYLSMELDLPSELRPEVYALQRRSLEAYVDASRARVCEMLDNVIRRELKQEPIVGGKYVQGPCPPITTGPLDLFSTLSRLADLVLHKYDLSGPLLVRVSEHAAAALGYYRWQLLEVLQGVRCGPLDQLLKEFPPLPLSTSLDSTFFLGTPSSTISSGPSSSISNPSSSPPSVASHLLSSTSYSSSKQSTHASSNTSSGSPPSIGPDRAMLGSSLPSGSNSLPFSTPPSALNNTLSKPRSGPGSSVSSVRIFGRASNLKHKITQASSYLSAKAIGESTNFGSWFALSASDAWLQANGAAFDGVPLKDTERSYLWVVAQVNSVSHYQRNAISLWEMFESRVGAGQAEKEEVAEVGEAVAKGFDQVALQARYILLEGMFTTLLPYWKSIFTERWLGGAEEREPSTGTVCERLVRALDQLMHVLKGYVEQEVMLDQLAKKALEWLVLQYVARLAFTKLDTRSHPSWQQRVQEDRELFKDFFGSLESLPATLIDKQLEVMALPEAIVTEAEGFVTAHFPLLQTSFQGSPWPPEQVLAGLLSFRGGTFSSAASRRVLSEFRTFQAEKGSKLNRPCLTKACRTREVLPELDERCYVQ